MERCPHLEVLSSLARTRLGAGAAVEPPRSGDAVGGDERGEPGGHFALFDLGFRPFYLGAALFVTVWEIFAIAFRRELAEPTSIITDASATTPLPSAIITDTSAGSSLSTSPRPATPS